MARLHKTFRGKTPEDIEIKFGRWRQENVDKVFNIRKHPIKQLDMEVLPMGVRHETMEALDGFSMRVEYDEKKLRRK
jgi:hypothetical protein